MRLSLTRRRAVALALPVALAAAGATVFAQTSNEGSMMTAFLCRPSLSGENPNAKMIAGSTTLVCKPFAVSVRMEDGAMKTIGNVTAKPVSGPDFTGTLTVQQANAAYSQWVRKTFRIDPATEHSP